MKNLILLKAALNFISSRNNLTHAQKEGVVKLCQSLADDIEQDIRDTERDKRNNQKVIGLLSNLLNTLPADTESEDIKPARDFINSLDIPF